VASRIRTLPESVSNRIAAGEVIEGPASVVKELIENAIDAGATAITIDVKGGGSDVVRVGDDGVGMNRDDAVAAFDRFATSKIAKESDLWGVETLGFRGEALPSIASVSRLRLVTCEPQEVEGTEVAVVGGVVKDVRPAARSAGTTVEVSSLFFNTPARRKFLRSDRVETRRVVEVVTEYAVLHPAIRFDMSVDGRQTLALPQAESLVERVTGILGAGPARELFPVAAEEDGHRLTGLVGKPSIAMARSTRQLIAVNGRPVRSRALMAAVRSGYGELLPRGRYPVVYLLLEIDGPLVDVNVHPTKREVRFGEQPRVFGLIERAVRETLLSHDAAATLEAPGRTGYAPERGEAQAVAVGELPLGGAVREATGPPAATLAEPPEARPSATPAGEESKFWQLHRKYIFVQTREGVLLVDQHAAHERVVYERVRRQLSGAIESGPGQQLLFPAAVELDPVEWQTFEGVHELLSRLGFEIRPLSGRTILLESVPAAFSRWPQDQILRDILSEIPEGTPALRDLIESIAATCACKATIRTGDTLTEEEMRGLLDQLFATDLPYSCPHGRPTIMRITLDELDKRFGRT